MKYVLTSMAPKGKSSSGDESSGNRRRNPPATYRLPASGDEDDGGYPETIMFPPAPAFPPPMAEPAEDGGYPETVMFPPQKPKAGRPTVDDDGGYPETVMFPPQQPASRRVDDGGGYPETVMFPPQQPSGQVDDGHPATVQYPPQRPVRQWNEPQQSPPVEFPPRGSSVRQGNDRRQPETVSWPPQPQRPPRPTSTPAFVPGNPWNSQLFDCGQDSNNAVITAFCPCVTFGQIAEIVDQGQTSCVLGGFMYGLLMSILCCSLVGATYRSRLRQMYNLNEAAGDEWILHIFCPFCALCQEYRELYTRGLDPSIGWAGLVAGQGQQTNQQMTPPKMLPPMRR